MLPPSSSPPRTDPPRRPIAPDGAEVTKRLTPDLLLGGIVLLLLVVGVVFWARAAHQRSGRDH